jgi:monoamine oxidase
MVNRATGRQENDRSDWPSNCWLATAMPNGKKDCEIAIIGAGAAGLAAASLLALQGKSVRCLEATGRIGGRIRTLREPGCSIPVELGAEFVHGRPPELWNIVKAHGLAIYEHSAGAVHIEHGRVRASGETGDAADRLLSGAAAKKNSRDRSLADLAKKSRQPKDQKEWAVTHLEGFNAARRERISVKALQKDAEAADEIEGERAFRILNGYDSVPLSMLNSIPNTWEIVRLNQVVEEVQWQPGDVRMQIRSNVDGRTSSLRCSNLIVTVPLGILQAEPGSEGAIRFDPPPSAVLNAAATLEFGQVYRVNFRFDQPFWENDPRLRSGGFWVSQERLFPTWWSSHPVVAPVLTGWSAGTAGEALLGFERPDIIAAAVGSLSRILNRKIPRVIEAYFHDWQADPFYRGAYSYVPVHGLPARKALCRPVENTLFFAGEATDPNGNGGTVHGAIASGRRAANQVLKRKPRGI